MFPNRTISSGDGSFPSSGEFGRNSSMPSLKGRPLMKPARFPPHFGPPSNPYIFDASKFMSEKMPQRSRYMDRDREKHVTRWLMEAQDALDNKKKVSSKKKPFLRRFHSQESNKDFISGSFDESWNDNFILADNFSPKKSKPLLRRFQSNNESFDGELGSTFDRTSESNGSKMDLVETPSPQSTGAASRKLSPRDFLERYSLPKVVSVEGDCLPLLMYRHIPSYTRVEAVRLVGKKGKPVGKPVYIPEGYQGWFALVGEKGSPLARCFNTIAELVKARIPYFLPSAPLSAYFLQRDPESERWCYVKGNARAGTPLRLSGVFEEPPKAGPGGGKTPSASPPPRPASPSSPSPRRYAQLIDPNMTELYVPLSTKGEFYPIEDDSIAPRIGGISEDEGLQRISALLKRSLPLRVKLVAGPAPPPTMHPTITTGTLMLRAVTTEAVLVMCSLPESNRMPTLSIFSLNTDKKIQRSSMGYDSEKKLFLSNKVHKALTFCQINVDSWIRQIAFAVTDSQRINKQKFSTQDAVKDKDVTLGDRRLDSNKFEKERRFTFQGFKVDASRLFGKSDKVLKDIPDENEGSIIFISKNELENMNLDMYSDDEGKPNVQKDEEDKTQHQQFVDEKMKVFRENNSQHPKLSKWFKHLKILRSTDRLNEEREEKENLDKLEKYKEFSDPFDPYSEQGNSLERYQDTSKLIQDRFGKNRLNGRRDDMSGDKWQSYRSLTSSSDIGISQPTRVEPKRVLTKSVSVQTGILDPCYNDEVMSEIGQKKNLSIEQINYYSENDSSLKKKQIYSGNCARRLENEYGKSKSSRFERRQRIRPDLIPEKSDIASTESFNQIQSCEDLNALSSCSSRVDNMAMPVNQNSFITEKLCSEFHVKTKKILSKSTSNLLHSKDKKEKSISMLQPHENKSLTDLSKTANTVENDDSISESQDDSKEGVKLKRSISSIQNRKLPVIEDLPYGQVADALTGRDRERRDSDNSDNIYAEICNPNPNSVTNYETTKSQTENVSIDSAIVKDERRRRQKEDQFKHIEVVVIEKKNVYDNNSDSDFVDSDPDDKMSENISQKYSSLSGSGGFSAANSLEKDKNVSEGVPKLDKIHKITLEITHGNYDDFNEKPIEIERTPFKTGSYVKFSKGITDEIPSEENPEAIYNTLK